jgi:hypothetical protein
MVHRPSGIRVPEQVSRFHLTRHMDVGELYSSVAIYGTDSETNAAQVYFASPFEGSAGETCDSMIDRTAGYIVRKVWFKEHIGPWRDLEPLFAGMEAGRAAVYNTELRENGSIRLMRSDIYILCGTGGSWIVDYQVTYPRDIDGSGWIDELIAATAPH